MRGALRGLLCGAAAAVAIGANAWAAGAPALRNGAGEAEIEAWISEHVKPGADEMRGVTYDSAVEYYDPRQLEVQADGHVVVQFHLEHWQPQKEGRVAYRSERQRVEIDCQANRFRFLAIEAFAENNLQGRATPLSVDSAWSTPLPQDELNGLEVRQVCSFASLIEAPGRDAGMPRPPQALDDASYDGWIAANVKPGDDVFLHRDGFIGYYYAPADLERGANGNLRAWVRQELLWPIVLGASGVRSTRTQYEIDCAGQRSAIRDLIVFPGQNQTGAPYAEFGDDSEALTAIKAGSASAPILRAFCRLAEDRTLSVADALRTPTPPAPSGTSEAALDAWVQKHVNSAGYVVSSYDPAFAILYDPTSLTLAPGGRLALTVRREGLQAPEPGRGRSMLLEMEFDCAARRARIISLTTYRNANLEGDEEVLGGMDLGRVGEDSHEALLMSEICPLRGLLGQDIDREAALTPPPVDDSDEASVIAWAAEYVRPLDYVYAGRAAEAVGLFSWSEGERTRQDYVRVWTRFEYFMPQLRDQTVVRSMRRLVEYDCDQGRSRILETETYPGANLTGRPTTRRQSTAEWSFDAPATLESQLATAVCDVRDAADEADKDAVSAPRLPGRSDRSPL